MFMTRAITAVLALAVFLAALFYLPQQAWAFFLLIVLAIGGWEWGGLASFRGAPRTLYSAIIVISALLLFYMFRQTPDDAHRVDVAVYAVSCIFWVVVAPLWLAKRWSIRNPLVLGVAGWIALVPMWLALVRLQPEPWALLTILSVVWIADTAAYLAGKTWGRHKLAPAISPGKSWEGVLGALVAVAVYYGVLLAAVPDGQRYFTGVVGLAVFAAILVLSIEGDLFESWMKRQVGLKDSGQILPGHGGILDRIDGLTATVPVAALALYLR
jgi:phosphatidate cytidylyltransferase